MRYSWLVTSIIVSAIVVGTAGVLHAMLMLESRTVPPIHIDTLVVAGTAVALIFVQMRLPNSVRLNLATTMFTTMLALAAAETFYLFRISVPETSRHALAASEAGVPFDTRTKLEVIRGLERDGIEALPAINPFKIEGVFPLGGRSDTTTVACNELGEYLIYKSDEHGFHNPKGLYRKGQVSVVSLGDSFTHGSCVKSTENFSALVRRRYPVTLNFGRGGAGPMRELATLVEYAKPLEPEVVLWVYFEGNDLPDLEREKNSTQLLRYLEPGYTQNLFSRQAEIDEAITAEYRREMARVSGVRGIVNSMLDFVSLRYLRKKLKLLARQAVPEADLDLLREILDKANSMTKSWGGRLYFVYLTGSGSSSYDGWERPMRRQVLHVAESLGIPVIDAHARMTESGDPRQFFPFGRDGHYNPSGQKIVAEAILDAIAGL